MLMALESQKVLTVPTIYPYCSVLTIKRAPMARKPTNSGKPWTPANDKQLKQEIKQNTPTRVLGLHLGRTPGAVQSHANSIWATATCTTSVMAATTFPLSTARCHMIGKARFWLNCQLSREI